MSDAIYKKVKDIIVSQLELDDDKVQLTSDLQRDLGADSLDLVDLVMSFEEEYEIEIKDEDVEHLKTLGDIVSYVEEHTDN